MAQRCLFQVNLLADVTGLLFMDTRECLSVAVTRTIRDVVLTLAAKPRPY